MDSRKEIGEFLKERVKAIREEQKIQDIQITVDAMLELPPHLTSCIRHEVEAELKRAKERPR